MLFASGTSPTADEQDTVYASSTYGPKQTQRQELLLARNMLCSPAVRHLLLANKILDSPAVAVDQSDTAATWLPLANKIINLPAVVPLSLSLIFFSTARHTQHHGHIPTSKGTHLPLPPPPADPARPRAPISSSSSSADSVAGNRRSVPPTQALAHAV